MNLLQCCLFGLCKNKYIFIGHIYKYIYIYIEHICMRDFRDFNFKGVPLVVNPPDGPTYASEHCQLLVI